MANSQDIDDFFRRCKIDENCKVEGQKITVSLLIELLDKFSTEQIKKLNLHSQINSLVLSDLFISSKLSSADTKTMNQNQQNKKNNNVNNNFSIVSPVNITPVSDNSNVEAKIIGYLIEKYENTKRGLYSGAIGYFAPNSDFDFNVVIRSIQYNESKQYLNFEVGSAITYDSDANLEYEECLLKAQAMMKALAG